MADETRSRNDDWLQKNNLSGADCTIEQRTFSRWLDTGIPVGADKLYTDFKQGSCNDCYFIAALISVAYRAPGRLRNFPNYQFYNTENRGWENVTTTITLAVDGANQIVYARPNNVNKIWACLYEKAYAKWLARTNSDEPSMGTLCGGGGITALLHILGGTWNGTTFTNLIRNPAPNTIPVIAGGVTQHPTVAKTKNGAGAGLTSNHTYSVLKRTATGLQLRNPCGAVNRDVTFAEFSSNFNEWGYVIPP